MGLGKIIAVTSGIGFLGAALFGFSGQLGIWGSRGTYDEFTTQYNGKPAVVRFDDERFRSDRCYILIDNKDRIINGSITDDLGRKITVGGVDINGRGVYNVRDPTK